ncbi:MAG: hypothetical protein HOI95_11390 [Chromatiales bacterium]|jgi:hypothetical protein|nr:hypothetical protein [Chromatiales bacterium]
MGSVQLISTATKLTPQCVGSVVVCGSHGGAYAGYLVARGGVLGFFLNDASVGLDAAGIGCLALAEEAGMAAATIAHSSARIGDAEDMFERGIVSHVNGPARSAGCLPGMTCSAAAAAMATASPPTGDIREYQEARQVAGRNAAGLEIVCVDSISLVEDKDAGQIVVSGSHGAIVSSQPGLAIKVKAAFALYNDAGIGRDKAGITRLPALDAMGVAAATVTASSARIGDAMSTLNDGVISAANELAQAAGVRVGARASDMVQDFTPTLD